jgi:hypothetical protein
MFTIWLFSFYLKCIELNLAKSKMVWLLLAKTCKTMPTSSITSLHGVFICLNIIFSILDIGYAVAPGYQQGGPYQAAGAPPGYQPIPTQQPSYMVPAGTAITVQPQSSVVVVGGCPACRVSS